MLIWIMSYKYRLSINNWKTKIQSLSTWVSLGNLSYIHLKNVGDGIPFTLSVFKILLFKSRRIKSGSKGSKGLNHKILVFKKNTFSKLKLFKWGFLSPSVFIMFCTRYENSSVTQLIAKRNCYSYYVKGVQIGVRSFFWSVFFYIRTEYGDLLRKFPYSVRIQENMDQK